MPVEDLARYFGKIIKQNQQLKQDVNKNYVQYGVVRDSNAVEVAGTLYPAIFSGVDDNFQVGNGVKVAFMAGGQKVMVIGR